MKHLGLIIAVVLGVIGAALNFIYLSNKARNFEKVAFLAVKSDTHVRAGDTFTEEHFVSVEIPRAAVSRALLDRVVLYDDRGTVKGMKATRDYAAGEFILHEDLKTPPAALELEPNERAMWVPVDSRTFVPALVRPGDRVSFLIPKGTLPAPPPSSENGDEPPGPPLPVPGNSELVGPFKVLSVGNRLGSSDVFRSAGMPQQQENVLTISVHAEGENQLEPRARKLFELLQAGGYRQAGVVLHPRGGN